MIFLLPIFFIFSSFASDGYHFNQSGKIVLGNRFHFGVGFDLFEIQYKSQRYEFQKYTAFKNPIDNAISRIAWNISYRITENSPFYIGVRTNRGINFPTQEWAYDTILKQKVRVDIKSEADSLYFATAIHKRVLPFIIATRLQSKSIIYYNNGLTFTGKQSNAMYGIGVATPLGNKGTASFTYYLPNKEFNTKKMFGISVNYFLV